MTSGKSALKQRQREWWNNKIKTKPASKIKGLEFDFVVWDEETPMENWNQQKPPWEDRDNFYRREEERLLERLRQDMLEQFRGYGYQQNTRTRPNGSTSFQIHPPAPVFSIRFIGGPMDNQQVLQDRKACSWLKDGEPFDWMLPARPVKFGDPEPEKLETARYKAIFIPESDTEHFLDHDFQVVIALLAR